MEVIIHFLERHVGSSLAGERNDVLLSILNLMKFNGNLGASKDDGLNALLYWFFFRLFIEVLLEFFVGFHWLLHHLALELELPRFIRDDDLTVLGLDLVVEHGHNVECLSIYEELRRFLADTLLFYGSKGAGKMEISVKFEGIFVIWSTSAVLSASAWWDGVVNTCLTLFSCTVSLGLFHEFSAVVNELITGYNVTAHPFVSKDVSHGWP